ncbi:MAG: hypothetical protein K2N99_02565, partial [Malacoplasma sp.]|nr:hypothetical protein [Malacoplasma sp.]
MTIGYHELIDKDLPRKSADEIILSTRFANIVNQYIVAIDAMIDYADKHNSTKIFIDKTSYSYHDCEKYKEVFRGFRDYA